MNTEPPKDIDQIIEEFLGFAHDVAKDKTADPKSVCQLGWLVLKIKECKTEAVAKNKTLAAVVTDNTLQQIEHEGKLD